ncbi:hypothetical protein EmuJ_000514000 [Echinococcus multilocularis]|uniref:Uncharacterized protein n=1 Tax=Echinococcus multilocularis TaxID=6211 RepID=A0A068Y3V4_ECHMU|nr:hypothetical protein EmuJ_000514000 [Echinococcus multilocularis]
MSIRLQINKETSFKERGLRRTKASMISQPNWAVSGTSQMKGSAVHPHCWRETNSDLHANPPIEPNRLISPWLTTGTVPPND